MFFLPHIQPLHQHIPAQRTNIPELLEKLASSSFTGYLQHTVPPQQSCCIFASGKMICAVSSGDDRKWSGLEAISRMFQQARSLGGELALYRLTPELAMCMQALALGTQLFQGSDVRQVDMKGILVRLKQQGLNGVVHFSTDQRSAMIFYREGQAFGFHHDDSPTVDTSPEESRKVAALPGARLDVYTTRPLNELLLYDLLSMANLEKLWQGAVARAQTAAHQAEESQPTQPDAGKMPDADLLLEVVEDLRELSLAYLSKSGRSMFDTQLETAGGATILADSTALPHFLEQVRQEALLLDGEARIDEMIELMHSEAARLKK